MRRCALWMVVLAASLWAPAAQAQTEIRVALVVGNGAYQHAEPLRNPVNDARAMAKVLRDSGFEVILRENATRRVLTDALREFSGKMVPGGVGLFFYAGHGIQVRGLNYLVPVDAALSGEDELKYETIDVNDVLLRLDEARARLSLVILDACRDNPFARRFRSTARGLAQTDAPRGTVIAYATAPGESAADGDGENGLYTTELLKAMAMPGLKIEEVFKRTLDGVARTSGNKQIPWVSSSFRGDFVFKAGIAAAQPAPSSPAVPQDAVEQTTWVAIANSDNPAVFEVFLQRFPSGVYAEFARARLEQLKAAEARRAAPATLRPDAAAEEAKRRSAAAEDEKKGHENAEAALKLADIDRRRIQAALTAKGFDTLGTDGAFGPRTRLMITNWQRSRNEPPTGFVTAAQAALLSREGEVLLARLEEERRKAEAERQRATPPAPVAQAALPTSPLSTRVTLPVTANSNTQCDKAVSYGLEVYPNNFRIRFSTGWQDFPVASDGSFGRAVAPTVRVNLEVKGNIRNRFISVTNVGNMGCSWAGTY